MSSQVLGKCTHCVRVQAHSVILMKKIEILTYRSALGLKYAFYFPTNYATKCFCYAEHLATDARDISTMHLGLHGKSPLVPKLERVEEF
jgi:hypothetical protein